MTHSNNPARLASFSLKRRLNKWVLNARRVTVISHPRSGRTWLRQMLHDISIEPKFTHAGSKNHLRLHPDEICQNIELYHRRRIVFLHRDPRDVLVSYFHHCCRQDTWDGDLSTFIRDSQNGLEQILAFNLGWLAASADFADFMVVGYEDLRADPRRGLTRMIKFMRCSLVRDSDIDHAIANNTFRNMKKREQSGELHARFGDRFTLGGDADDRMIVRRGVIGGHSDELDTADQEFCEELLRRYDYSARLSRLITCANAEAVSPD
jgi:hypothetical protein